MMIDNKHHESNTDVKSEEIVISGIAGRFPLSDNMKQLQENLFNKVDLTTSNHNRYKVEIPDLPKSLGIINNVNKFDAEFFNVSDIEAHLLDPQVRMLLEHTYEALIDAGVNPKQMRGKNTATIVATTYFESQKKQLYRDFQMDGKNLLGCCKPISSNMLSLWLDLKGPSLTVDAACSSGIHALAIAYQYIKSGLCEDAIVAGINLCTLHTMTLQFARLGVLSPNDKCRPFDVNANGYCRAETVSVVYLQKAKHAKRIYAICKHIKLNSDGYKIEGITFPSKHAQEALLSEFYTECGISPMCLDYVEAHGTGTLAGDPQEIDAIYNVLCKDKKTPLLIGSVKSNLGHSEPASTFNQVAKIIIAMETGFIPPNINFTSPRKDIESLQTGTVRVITESTPLKNGYVSMNSFGFGGANGHLLLKWHPKLKINKGAPSDDLPRLVTLSGRTEEAVKSFLNDVTSNPIDVEYIRLLHDIHADNINGHLWRGYIILDTARQHTAVKEIQAYKTVNRPVCFIFSGMDSKWLEIGQHLIKFPVFANAVKICDDVLKKFNISVINIVTTVDETIYKNPLTAWIGSIAFQIGLVDILTSLRITPDNVIGYSLGELGCAYADKCLTIEETILSAYFIGSTLVESNVSRVSTAIVYLDYENLKNICPVDIEISYNNNRNSSVVSGSTEHIRMFVRKLQANNIDAQEISSNDIPYHTRYLASIKPQLLKNLSLIISQPKIRSPRWISTSVSCTEWSTSTARLCSADYHTNSILTTVLFDQATREIPNNSVTIEIAPNSVLQHILKESLSPQVTNIALIQRMNENPINVMLQKIGELYNCGLNPQLAALYPPVELPVSRGTPMISPSIKWNHSKDWYIIEQINEKSETRERHVEIKLLIEEFEYMSGHVIDGRTLLPAMGYILLVWETISLLKGEFYAGIPVVFRDLRFIRATHLPKTDSVNLVITIHKDSGKFEVRERDSVVVTGAVSDEIDFERKTSSDCVLLSDDKEEEHMNTRDIYKELKLRGYHYSGAFRGLQSASVTGNKGHVVWMNNWVTFMDTMLQLYILQKDTKNLYVPTSIRKIIIDPALHSVRLQDYVTQDTKHLPVRVYKNIGLINSGGIEIWDAKATSIARRKPNADPVIEEHRFVAYHDREKISLNEAIRISIQFAVEDHQLMKVKAIELVEDADIASIEELAFSALLEACNNLPLVQATVTLMTSPTRFNASDLPPNVILANLENHKDDKVSMIIGFNLLSKRCSLEQLLPFLREGGYLLSREKYDITETTESHRVFSTLIDNKILQQFRLNVVLEKYAEKEMIVLLKQQVTIKETTVVHITNDNFEWLETLKLLVDEKKTINQNKRIVVVSEGDFDCGLLGFVNCLRKEPGGDLIRGLFIQDKTAPKFTPQDPFYAQQLQKDMTINILRPNKTWGSYRHFCLPAPEPAPVPAAYVCQTVLGDLSTFCWVENNISINSHRDDLVRVIYSSINFKDVMLATGKLTSEGDQERFERMNLGMEYVGFDSKGRRVMGVRNNKCIANIILKSDLQWVIPDTWTFEEAATVPCVYSTSYYALYIKGKMKKGDKVLIHSGSGGVGQSAIHLALHEGCEVFTTVGTAEKKRFIQETFPAIPDDHIGNSHDISFEAMIMRQTNGRGVDIVLNSLAEEKLLASVRCLTRNGRFLEIGKFDFVSDNPLDVSLCRKGISFYGVFLDLMFVKDHKYKEQLLKLMIDGIKNNVIKPLKAKVFQRTEIEKAFRYMASGKHIGKILLQIQETDKCHAPIIAHPCYYCRSDRTYIILGGLGGFGLELTEWLISRGARNFMLTSRSGIKNGYQHMKISLWRSYGVKVTIVKDSNSADSTDCERLLLNAEKLAPVDAIFNLAVVLKDNFLKKQTADTFVESFRAKAWSTQLLDKLSRKICPKLRHFVVFSSVSCGRGNAGQTNYGMANSVMERICERRVKEGFHGLAIQWGAIGDVGLVADMQEDNKELVIGGTLQQGILSCLDELGKFLLQNRPIVSTMVVAEKKQRSLEASDIPHSVADIMNINDITKISRNTYLSELGIDSMMAVEIKQILERDFDLYLSLQEIRTLTFGKLFEMSDTKAIVKKTPEDNAFNTNKQNFLFAIGIVQNEDFISEVFMDFSTKNEDSTTQVFLIPGIEGCGTIFKYLESYIKFSTTTLNYNTGIIPARNTLSETVEFLEQDILTRLRNKKEFIIVGYSFGSIFAIELAKRLETLGFKGRIILIDGAPDQLILLSKQNLAISADSNNAEIQISILTSILHIYNIKISEKDLIELQKCKNDEARFDIFAKHFLAQSSMLSLINLKTLYTTLYKHILIIQKYDAVPHIKLPVTLLRPTSSWLSEAEEDYGLHKITSDLKIHYVEETHVSIVKNPKIISLINGEI